MINLTWECGDSLNMKKAERAHHCNYTRLRLCRNKIVPRINDINHSVNLIPFSFYSLFKKLIEIVKNLLTVIPLWIYRIIISVRTACS